MPLPPGVEISQLFTIQPGGSVPSKPVPISFPNTNHADPGTRASLDYFDIVSGTWKSYGQGTVSANGKQIVPDAGVGIPRFAWHYAFIVTVVQNPPLNPNSCETATLCNDPVEMSTGIFRLSHTDMAIGGKTPISLTRHYRSYSTDSGPFGPGTGMEYDYRLQFFTGNLINLVYPNGERTGFSLSSPGVFINTQRPGYLASVLTQSGSQYTLRQADGTVMLFNGAYLSTITDPNGNRITLTRDGSNRVTGISNDTGQSISLYYDSNNHLLKAVDTIGRVVYYGYDLKGNLNSFTDAVGNITRYEYNTTNSQTIASTGLVITQGPDLPYRMTKIIDARNNPQVENF
ncbi:MAG: RHS repeat protein, partial [Chloroflexi bacterium]|nr:RHS repeat protein [Chloroflexota bacterium]